MNESFVVHAEYLADIPPESRTQFYAYIMEYGIWNKVPDVSGFELTFWKTVQRRIDTDRLNYQISVYNSRLRAIDSRINASRATETDLKNREAYSAAVGRLSERLDAVRTGIFCGQDGAAPQGGTCGTERTEVGSGEPCISCGTCGTSTPECGSDCGLDAGRIHECDSGGGGGSDSDGARAEQAPPPQDGRPEEGNAPSAAPSAAAPPQEEYARRLFGRLKDAGLPCRNGDFFGFLQCDFKNALPFLRGYSSQEVIAALDNYIAELRNPDSYIRQEYNLESFAKSRTFTNCLPANYRAVNFLRRDVKAQAEKPSPPRPDTPFQKLVKSHPVNCGHCGAKLSDSSGSGLIWYCRSCRAEWQIVGDGWQETG